MKEKKTSYREKFCLVEATSAILQMFTPVEVRPIDPNPPAIVREGVDRAQSDLYAMFKKKEDREYERDLADGEEQRQEHRKRQIDRMSDALDKDKKKSRSGEVTNKKNKGMSSKNELLSQMKKNASDITSKSELLKKKIDTPPKDATLSKKDLLTKKFNESKPQTRQDRLDKKMGEFRENKKDILGVKKPDTKNNDKPKAELKPKVETKPDKPKLR